MAVAKNEIKLINGHTVTELIALLTENFEEVGETHDGFPTLTIEQYAGRINSVIGMLNYDYDVSSPIVTQVGNQTTITVAGKITVRYDDGTVFCIKSGIGSERVSYVKDTDIPVSLENSFKSADTDAFKICCRRLGIGDCQLRTLKAAKLKEKSEKDNGKKHSSSKSASNDAATTKVLRFTGEAKALSDKGFKIPAVTEDGEILQVIIWNSSDGMAEISRCTSLDKFVEYYKNRNITIRGDIRESNYNGGKEIQLIVSGFQTNKAA